MLKTVEILNIFVDSLMNIKFKRTAFIWNSKDIYKSILITLAE